MRTSGASRPIWRRPEGRTCARDVADNATASTVASAIALWRRDSVVSRMAATRLLTRSREKSAEVALRPGETVLCIPVYSPGSLYELLTTGQLASVHIGRSRRIPMGELRRYIRERLQREHSG